MPKAIPEFDTDPFSRESVVNARAVDDRLRELAPVVRLPRENITMLARFEHVAAGLKDWKSFSSTSRPWHDPNSVRPELLLTDDPPKHTPRARGGGERALAAGAVAYGRGLSPRRREHRRRFAHAPRTDHRCGRRYHATVRLQGAARSDRPAAAGARTHVRLRQHGVGDDGADERVVP